MRLSHKSLILLLLAASRITAQNPSSVQIGDRLTIQSAVLNESREYFLYVPENAVKPLPLILVFDAESLFDLTVTTSRFMCYSSEVPQMPEAIVVGIPNTDRNRDMPAPRSYDGEGEVKFRQLISDELMPRIGKQYALNGHTIMVGHSQGALFATYLLAEFPNKFNWAIAIDAPVNVDPKTAWVREKAFKVLGSPDGKNRYVSAEAIYGWGQEWSQVMTGTAAADRTHQVLYPDETHESIPGKCLYEAFKFLFKDFAPPRKDLKLAALQEYYATISSRYGFSYDIPLRVLLGSGARKQRENRKQELLDIANYAESNYGASVRITNFKNAASQMTEDGAAILDHYLNLPKPTADQVKPFLGQWRGEQSIKQTPPPGVYMPRNKEELELEIVFEDGGAVLRRVHPPWARDKKVDMEIFHVTSDGELIYGFRNRGAGLIISKARITAKGILAGSQQGVGMSAPAGMPEEDRKREEFMRKNPATFELTRQR